jgi:glycosidase
MIQNQLQHILSFGKAKMYLIPGRNSRILLFWTAKGVDGFRYDMAEMVPYEFWSYMNSAIKMQNADAFIGRSIQSSEYRNLLPWKMDYMYVETYDKLKM